MQGTVRRLHERSPLGRPVAVEITTPDVGLEVGYRFAVLGTEISMTSGRVQWTGTPTGRPPTLEDAAAALVRTGTHALEHRVWTDSDRAEARRLQAEGLSWARIAERVCGDKRYKPTVGSWLRPREQALPGTGLTS